MATLGQSYGTPIMALLALGIGFSFARGQHQLEDEAAASGLPFILASLSS